MSEYQYYEFQAIDRPLTDDDRAELREITSRATITPTRLVNVYQWGSFKGDPLRLMERYFDAFVYVANWGTNRFMVRLPRRVLDPEIAQRYCSSEGASVQIAGDQVILDFVSEDEDSGRWVEDEEAEGWMPELLPVRAELAGGDLRALYLAWLADASSGATSEDEIEPPVPPGLGQLSASLKAFAEFLRVDEDLIDVAAERSASLRAEPAESDFEQWIRQLPETQKNELLLRLIKGEEFHLRAMLLRQFREAHPVQGMTGDGAARTVAELIERTEERAADRQRAEAARKAAEQARLARELAAARAKYLDGLAGREEDVWRQIEALIEIRQGKPYDQAVQLLVDLRDLADRKNESQEFNTRLHELRVRHAKKPTFIGRIDKLVLGHSAR